VTALQIYIVSVPWALVLIGGVAVWYVRRND
jgi:hypothetical protein